MTERRFVFEESKRSKVPLLISVSGGSFSGKTFTAHRLATGIARIYPGRIVVLDTEGNRALHYAEQFSTVHCSFAPPYGSLDYVEALNQALLLKPSVIIVDSGSHEHEGEGGYLDLAEHEAQSGKNAMQKWNKPQAGRRRLRSRIQTLPVPTIFCFQADEKNDWKAVTERRSKEPEKMGETMVGSTKFAYEMTIRFLLRQGSDGVPTWQSDLPGERAAIKLPLQFRELFSGKPRQVTEADGEALARWANGDAASAASKSSPPTAAKKRTLTEDEIGSLGAGMAEADDLIELEEIRAKFKGVALTDKQREDIVSKYETRKRELAEIDAAADAEGDGR